MDCYGDYKNNVLKASLWLSENGFFGSKRGTGGNVSMRIMGENAMAITPSSSKYQELTVHDICIVGFDLSLRKGKLKPSVESGMHSIIYQQRPDVNAIVHTHQIFGSVFAVISEPIPALFDEVAFALGDTVDIVPYALSGTPDLAANVSGKLSNNSNAYIIQNHGILALGKDLDSALLHAELLEKVSEIYCVALSTGKKIQTLPTHIIDMIRAIRDQEVKKGASKSI
jgi:ribulose-5-phosphate 4-epimerase/fuculose-1-phosphate aldolase